MPVRATPSDDSDEWASRFAQDDSVTVILKRKALKNPGCRRTCCGRVPFYGRDSCAPQRVCRPTDGVLRFAQDDMYGETG